MTTAGSDDRYDFFDPWGGPEEPQVPSPPPSSSPRWRPVRTAIPSPWSGPGQIPPPAVPVVAPLPLRSEESVEHLPEPVAAATPTLPPPAMPVRNREMPAAPTPPAASGPKAPQERRAPAPPPPKPPVSFVPGPPALGQGKGPPKQIGPAGSAAAEGPSVEDLAASLAGLPMPPLSVPSEPPPKLTRVLTVMRPEDDGEPEQEEAPPGAMDSMEDEPEAAQEAPQIDAVDPQPAPTVEAQPTPAVEPEAPEMQAGPGTDSLSATFVPRLPKAGPRRLGSEDETTSPASPPTPQASDDEPLSASLRATFVPRLPSAPRKSKRTSSHRPEPMKAAAAPDPAADVAMDPPADAGADATHAPATQEADDPPARDNSIWFGPPIPPRSADRPAPPQPEAPVRPSSPPQPLPVEEPAAPAASVTEWKAPPAQASAPDGPAGFLRDVGVPLIHQVTHRVNAAGHRTAVQDLLDLEPPVLRLVLWPRRGPMDPKGSGQATLELVVDPNDTAGVSARYWYDQDELDALLQARVPAHAVREDWLGTQVMDFLARALSRA